MTIEGDSSDYDLLSAHAEQLAKLEQMDKFSRRYDEGGQSDL